MLKKLFFLWLALICVVGFVTGNYKGKAGEASKPALNRPALQNKATSGLSGFNSPSRPLSSILDDRGNLKLGSEIFGSFDVSGYSIIAEAGKAPRFISYSLNSSEAKILAEGDENWDDRFFLGGGVDNTVFAIAVSGYDVYVGGNFRATGNSLANYVARWDGTVWSPLGTGMNGNLYSIAVSGSYIYAGGDFTTAGGVAANRMARWDGTTWSPLGSGFDSRVRTIAVSGSYVYAGGDFTAAGGVAANRMARWDGTAWSPLGTGMNGNLYSIAVSGSYVYAGGDFTTAGGVAANRMARWDGTTWSPLGSGFDSRVRTIAISGSYVYAGGDFTTAGGVAANRMARWDGTAWSPLGTGMNGNLYSIAVSGSYIYAGGDFTTAGGVAANRMARWDGTTWSPLGSGINGGIYTVAISESDVYAGGYFTTAGSVSANCISKWNGTSWSFLGVHGNGLNKQVAAISVSGSEIYVGGEFTRMGGTSANYIAKWNGTGWSSLGSGLNGMVLAIAISESNVYAGGWFTTAGGISSPYIAKWDGTNWSPLGSGFNNPVNAIAVSANEVYAGGGFTMAGGVSANYIAKWNGSSWAPLGSGVNGNVYAIAISGGDVYAGGAFTVAGGLSASHIAKWNGTSWFPLLEGVNNTVNAISIYGNHVYAGGNFTVASNLSAALIAKWDGYSWTVLGSGLIGNYVNAIAVSGDDVYVGGIFSTAGGLPASNIAKWDGRDWSILGSGVDNTVRAIGVAGTDIYTGGNFKSAGSKPSSYFARWIGPSYGENMYWSNTNSANNSIGKANKDGTGVSQNFITGCNHPSGILVYGNHIYWANEYTNKIGKANIDGTDIDQNWIATVYPPWGLATDGNFLYWTCTTGRIARANMDGSGTNLSWITGCFEPRGIALDRNYLYWANYSTNSIGRSNINGSGASQDWISGCNGPVDIKVTTTNIYWTNSTNGTIGRSQIDGSNPTPDWIAGCSSPMGIETDLNYVYWTNYSSNWIGRANLDGSGPNRNWIVGCANPISITAGHGIADSCQISGNVSINGSPLAGAILTGLPGDPATNASGQYSVSVEAGWSGQATPFLAGYAFAPGNRTYSNVTANQTGQDYSASVIQYIISGQVTHGGNPLSGVDIQISTGGSVTTDINGQYSIAQNYGWSGTVTPVKAGYSFTPPSTVYANLASNQTGNYSAALNTYTISGMVTVGANLLAGVTINGLPGNPVTNDSGQYTSTVNFNWSGTATPSLAGYTFSPVSRGYTSVIADALSENYTATLNTYTISGTILVGSTPLPGVTVGGLPGNPVTNASGIYTAAVDYGFSGTAAPSLAGYTFSPVSRGYTSVIADALSENYTATLNTYTISGTILVGSTPLPGVTVGGLPGNPVTNASGIYTATVDYGFSGTATPSLAGYTFSPVSRGYTSVIADALSENYTATLNTYTISGTILVGSTPLPGVTVGGLPGNPVTNASGIYTATVDYGFSGTATPSLAGYTFSPVSRGYTSVIADALSENYTATLNTYTISGTILVGSTPLPGVTVGGLPGNPVTNASGIYTAAVDYGFSGTATPSLAGYTFSPVSRGYTSVIADALSENYTATLNTYTISGTILVGSTPLPGVTVGGLPGNPVTNASGIYTAAVDYGFSGTATPSLAGYTFSPATRTYTNVTSNQTAQDYAATLIPTNYTVTFVEGAGGGIQGSKIQTVASGGNTTSVTASPKAGYQFTGWTGDYVGAANPLVIYNVTRNMTITANFKNDPPIVHITSPSNGAPVFGVVSITADATDDLAVSKINIYVDGKHRGSMAPSGAAPSGGQSAVPAAQQTAQPSRVLVSGGWTIDLGDSLGVLITAEGKLRKIGLDGELRAVMNPDVEVEHVQVEPAGLILAFRRAQPAADGHRYLLTEADFEGQTLTGINDEGVLFHEFLTSHAFQTDSEGRLYYFATTQDGSTAFRRWTRGFVPETLFSGRIAVNEWFVKPEGLAVIAAKRRRPASAG